MFLFVYLSTYHLEINQKACTDNIIMSRNAKYDRVSLLVNFDVFLEIGSVFIYTQSEVFCLKRQLGSKFLLRLLLFY